MSDIQDVKITNREIQTNGLQGVEGDRLNLKPNESKLRFDQLPTLIANRFNTALTKIDALVQNTEQQIRNDVDDIIYNGTQGNKSINTRITDIETKLQKEGKLEAEIGDASTVNVDTSRSYADISSGKVGISSVLGQLGANSNTLKVNVEQLSSDIESLQEDTQKLSSVDDGSRFGSNFNAFTVAGTYLTRAISFSNAPAPLSGASQRVWLTVKRETPTSSTIYQEIEISNKFSTGNVTHPVSRYFRVSTNGGSTWGAWQYDGVSDHRIFSGADTKNISYFRIGDILFTMGVKEIKPSKKSTQYDVKMTFPIAYATIPHLTTSLGASPETLCQVSANTISTTGFTISLFSSSTSTRYCRWMAIGRIG